jgi:hypothetical protein
MQGKTPPQPPYTMNQIKAFSMSILLTRFAEPATAYSVMRRAGEYGIFCLKSVHVTYVALQSVPENTYHKFIFERNIERGPTVKISLTANIRVSIHQ